MKFKIEIDCTPEEVRSSMGLPDLEPMQERLLALVEQKARDGLDAMDAERLLQAWLPLGMGGARQWQNMWSDMLKMAGDMQRGGHSEQK